jgi:hypothetical protein
MEQGYQMVCFKTKTANLGIIWRALEWKMLIYFSDIWFNLRPFDIMFLHFGVVFGPLVYFSRFGIFGPRKLWQPWDGARSDQLSI